MKIYIIFSISIIILLTSCTHNISLENTGSDEIIAVCSGFSNKEDLQNPDFFELFKKYEQVIISAGESHYWETDEKYYWIGVEQTSGSSLEYTANYGEIKDDIELQYNGERLVKP